MCVHMTCVCVCVCVCVKVGEWGWKERGREKELEIEMDNFNPCYESHIFPLSIRVTLYPSSSDKE